MARECLGNTVLSAQFDDDDDDDDIKSISLSLSFSLSRLVERNNKDRKILQACGNKRPKPF